MMLTAPMVLVLIIPFTSEYEPPLFTIFSSCAVVRRLDELLEPGAYPSLSAFWMVLLRIF